MKPLAGVFGLNSEYSRNISSAPLAGNSSALVTNLAQQVATRFGGTAAFNVWSYNVSTYTVSATTPRADVVWDNCQHKTYTPPELYNPAKGGIFLSVPIPSDAVPATGTDGELSIYAPSTDQLWEFWKANKQSDGWHACWGGRIDNASSSTGIFPGSTGATSTGLTAAAGDIGIAEAQALNINHAMSLMVVDAAHWTQFSYPAQRSDGGQPLGTVNAIVEGQRFRLDPSLDISALRLTPLARAIAVAAQKYGFIVDNKSGSVGLAAESGAGMAAQTGSANPWTGILGTTPSYSVMKNFPWGSLQALPLNYGR